MDTKGKPDTSRTAPTVAPSTTKHVWKSRAYGWVARVVHDDGAISFWSCDTEPEALDAVARGLRAGGNL